MFFIYCKHLDNGRVTSRYNVAGPYKTADEAKKERNRRNKDNDLTKIKYCIGETQKWPK